MPRLSGIAAYSIRFAESIIGRTIRAGSDFIPPEKLAEVWRRDYERMQEYFIYGDSLPYDRLIARMAELGIGFEKVVMEDDFFSES